MSTTFAPTSTTGARRPRLERRILTSGLVDLLAGPPGVDGYLEQIRPTWTVGACRAEVVGVERQTPDSVTLAIRANRAWEGFRAGPVHPARRRDRRLLARALLLARFRCRPRPRARADRQVTPRGTRLQLPARERAAGNGPRLEAGRGRVPPSRPATRPDPSDQRGQRHHPGDVDAADALRGGPSRPGHLPALRARPRARDLPRRARAARRGPSQPAPGPLLHARPRRRRGRRALQPLPARGRRAAPRPGRDLRLRPARPARRRQAGRGAAAGLDSRLHTESFVPPSSGAVERRRGGLARLRGLRACGSRTAAPPCSSRPRRPGSAPQFGCRMGICHTCSCRKTAGRVKNLSTGEVSSSDDEEIQICVSAPIGDVVVEL